MFTSLSHRRIVFIYAMVLKKLLEIDGTYWSKVH